MVLSIIDLSSVTYPFLSSWNGHDPAVEIFGASLKLLIAEISAINGGSLRYSLPKRSWSAYLNQFPTYPVQALYLRHCLVEPYVEHNNNPAFHRNEGNTRHREPVHLLQFNISTSLRVPASGFDQGYDRSRYQLKWCPAESDLERALTVVESKRTAAPTERRTVKAGE
jgi:hypothetical protein